MLKVFTCFEKVFNKIEDFLQFLSNVALIFIMLIISIDVLGRNFFNKPLKGTYEMTELVAALLVFFALAITHRHGDHITIDFLVERFNRKVQHWVNGVIEVCISFLLFYMSTHIFANGARMMERNATTTDLSIPTGPFLYITGIALIIFAITAFMKAINHFRGAVSKHES